MFTGNHKVVATHLMMARFKPAEGGTEHDGRSCNEQRCQSAKKKKGPFFEPKQAPAAREKIQGQTEQTKLQISFRYVHKGLEEI